jgi:hypothetical protein
LRRIIMETTQYTPGNPMENPDRKNPLLRVVDVAMRLNISRSLVVSLTSVFRTW